MICNVLVIARTVSGKVPKGSGAAIDPRRRGDSERVLPIVNGGKGVLFAMTVRGREWVYKPQVNKDVMLGVVDPVGLGGFASAAIYNASETLGQLTAPWLSLTRTVMAHNPHL